MTPTDIVVQLIGHQPDDDDIEWNGDLIRIHSSHVHSAHFRGVDFTRIDINLSQGIVYFLSNNQIVNKLAIALTLQPITQRGPTWEEPVEELIE